MIFLERPTLICKGKPTPSESESENLWFKFRSIEFADFSGFNEGTASLRKKTLMSSPFGTITPVSVIKCPPEKL